jgi:hypothetical protein
MYEIMWKNTVELDRQYGAWAFHTGYLTLQAHSEYVILSTFPLQQWLHKCVSMLCNTHTACLVTYEPDDSGGLKHVACL